MIIYPKYVKYKKEGENMNIQTLMYDTKHELELRSRRLLSDLCFRFSDRPNCINIWQDKGKSTESIIFSIICDGNGFEIKKGNIYHRIKIPKYVTTTKEIYEFLIKYKYGKR